MANYILVGHFKGKTDSGCTSYSVTFSPVQQESHLQTVEVDLAKDNPVIVKYAANSTPFDPLRESRMSITVVASEYFFDLFGDEAQHTQVVLKNDDSNTIEWCGFLTQNLLNMPQDNCTETFTLEARDCLSSLEFFEYETMIENKKQIVTFQNILARIMKRCVLIKKLYVDSTIKNITDTVIHMDELKISEQNFFSSDTDEPWTLKEVLTEICKFCGYTAIQWKDSVYLYDAQAHTDVEWYANIDIMSSYPCQTSSGTFLTYYNDTKQIRNCSVSGKNIRGTGADISLQTIYNTVTVQDNFYEIGDFLPDIYDDDYLTNKYYPNSSWESDQLMPVRPFKPKYVNKKNQIKEDVDDNIKTFYQRVFDHKWYSPIYRNPTNFNETTTYNVDWDVMDAYYVYTGNTAIGFYAKLSVKSRYKEAKAITARLFIGGHAYEDTYTIQPNGRQTYYLLAMNTIGQQIQGNPYITVDGIGPLLYEDATNVSPTRSNVCGVIMDCATIQNGNTTQYNYEIESNLNFDRYLCISQCSQPNTPYGNPRWSGFSITQLNYFFPSVFTLNSGWTKPIIIDDNSYITINGSAMYERYHARDYINPDWTSDCTGINNGYNVYASSIFTGTSQIYTTPPCLVFKLKIGDYYWNGTSWTQQEQPFYVNVHTPVDDDGYIDFSKWYNTDLQIINNVPWNDWTGIDGYKIPLTGANFDFNADIDFKVCLPGLIQYYTGPASANSGFNSYVWLKDLEIKFDTKGSENYDLSDVVYENVIDDDSLNTLSDITLKITSYPGEGQHSYSNVGYNNKLLRKCKKDGLDNVEGLMEENIIKKYVNQYNDNTILQTLILDLNATPMSRVKDTDMQKYFHVVSQEIDYAAGRQTVSLVESKRYTQSAGTITNIHEI